MRTVKSGLGTLAAYLLVAADACTNATSGSPGARSDAGGATPPPFGGATGGTTSGSNDAGVVPGGNACGVDPSDDSCSTCLKSSCSTAFAACVGDQACVKLVQCGNRCAAGDSSCDDRCVNTYPAGQSSALALVDCEQSTCAASCGGSAQPPPSTWTGRVPPRLRSACRRARLRWPREHARGT